MASILIVEDHPTFAHTAAEFLQQRDGLEVAAVVHTPSEALELLSKLSVDLALIDVSLAKTNGTVTNPTVTNGIELTTIIHEKYPDVLCLMLSGHRGPNYVRQALDAGARGYVTKGNPSLLLEAVEQVLKGELYLSPELREG